MILSDIFGQREEKQKSRPLAFLLGQENTCGATRLGAHNAPSYAYGNMQSFDHGETCSVLHTRRHTAFPIALGSPFSAIFSAAITPSAALCGKRENAYLLSLNGLGYFITYPSPCQELLPFFYRKRKNAPVFLKYFTLFFLYMPEKSDFFRPRRNFTAKKCVFDD